MRERLASLLEHRRNKLNGLNERVLEVMAGDGRNFSTLKDFFTNIEMLE